MTRLLPVLPRLKLALADWNFERLLETFSTDGALLSPLLVESASVTVWLKFATAETK